MFKNQENNATSTSEEITEVQRKKQYAEFLDSLEKSRAELEGKSVDEIKELSILKLAQYFCDVHLLIEYHQEYKRIPPDYPSKELKHNAHIYLQEHTKPDIDKFITTFDTLKTKILQLSQYEENSSYTISLL